MALVNTSDVFPSLVVLETDNTGELGEITGSPALVSQLDLFSDLDVTLTHKEAGDNNDLNIIVLDSQGGLDRVEYNSSLKQIQVKYSSAFTSATGATADFVDYNSAFTVSAVELGDLNGKLQFTVLDNVAGASANEVKVNPSDGDITVCLFDDISTGNGGAGYTNQDIHDLLTDSLSSWYTAVNDIVSIGAIDTAESANTAVNFQGTLDGGANSSGQFPTNGTVSVVNLINNDSVVGEFVTASGGTLGQLPVEIQTGKHFVGGTEAQNATFGFNQKYVCLRIDEIHSLLESEAGDARKVLWGMLETYAQYVLGQSVEQTPENFIVTRGNPALLIDNAGTRVRQTYTINAFYAIGDFDLEDETGV